MATDIKIEVEPFPLNTAGSSLGGEAERICTENELVISAWSPIHLRTELDAEFPNGVPDQIKRAVSENANSLGLKNRSWE